MQIRDLLDQYLAMGGQTPVAPEAQALADAIDQSSGAAGPDQGAPPPGGDMGGAGLPDPGVQPEHLPGGPEATDMGEQEPPPSDSKTYAGANVNALDRLKKRNKKDQG
jgi:hypothetical protein